MSQIYLIEDDAGIRGSLDAALTERGHVVRGSSSGLTALGQIVDDPPELVVLDLGLPDIDGTKVLDMLRATSSVPVIVATARNDESEVIRLLDAGADDYIVKPYSVGEIEARARPVLRRVAAESAPRAASTVGPLEVDPAAHTVRVDGAPVELTRKEFELLVLLAAAPERWCRSGRCWPRCGASRTVAPTRRSMSTCRGCGASSARPPTHRGSCAPCEVSA